MVGFYSLFGGSVFFWSQILSVGIDRKEERKPTQELKKNKMGKAKRKGTLNGNDLNQKSAKRFRKKKHLERFYG